MHHVPTTLAASLFISLGIIASPGGIPVHAQVPQDAYSQVQSGSQDQSGQDAPVHTKAGAPAPKVQTTNRSPEAAALAWSATLSSASTVIISTSATPADALTAGALQGAYDAPLLFSDRQAGLSAATLAEIRRLGASQAFILGGPQSVPPTVERQLANLRVERLSGPTRLETALAVAKAVGEQNQRRGKSSAPNGVLLVRSLAPNKASDPTAEFADALGAGAIAAEVGQVVLLTPADHLPAHVAAYLHTYPSVPVNVVGGPRAISDQVVAAVPATHPVKRIAGETRVETAVELARLRAKPAFGMTAVNAYASNAWAEGLAAATYVKRHNHALALVHPDHMREQLAYMASRVPIGPSGPSNPGGGTNPQPTPSRTPEVPRPTSRPSDPGDGQPPAVPTPTASPDRPTTPPRPRPTSTPPAPRPRPTTTPPTPKPRPTATPTPPKPDGSTYVDHTAEAKVIELMNAARTRRGLSPVKRNGALDENARAWSRVMLKAGDIWHPEDWAEQIETTIAANPGSGMSSAVAENLFLYPNIGAQLGERLFEGWDESKGHAQNMYSSRAAYVGIGVVCTPQTCFVTQRFAS